MARQEEVALEVAALAPVATLVVGVAVEVTGAAADVLERLWLSCGSD